MNQFLCSQSTIFVATEKGFGKRTSIDDYRITKRGGKGIVTMKVNDKIGKINVRYLSGNCNGH